MFLFFLSCSHEHIEILTVNGELLFFRQREGVFYPTLRLLHKCKFAEYSGGGERGECVIQEGFCINRFKKTHNLLHVTEQIFKMSYTFQTVIAWPLQVPT